MEQDIIIEGFKSSIEMHNLTYRKFIADGDSSVFTKIKEKVTYGLEVQKVECMNHVLKNYGKNLHKIRNDTKLVPLAARKILSKEILDELVKTVQFAIYANVQNSEFLREDIRNTYNHVFGNHLCCKEYLCENVGDCSQGKTKDVATTRLQHHIHGAMNQLLTKANLLLDKRN
uniref:Uncharacterized protein LOC114345145 n=1 Tax=Diabrotica virgifera virgifera TaxID=50390 RepID=A0A6P7H249_DIAVI